MLCPQCGSSEADTATACSACGSSFGLPAFVPGRVPPGAPDDETTGVTPPSSGPELDGEATMTSPSRPATTPADDEITMAPVATPGPRRRARRPTPVVSAPDPAGTSPEAGTDRGPLDIGQQFGRYTIIRLLGAGGMGAVYQAWDEELEVPVALKVVRPEAIRDPEVAREFDQRFKRELLLARQVTHRNVVRIHDMGDMEGIKYITMSYVPGVDLATLLKERGALPVPQVLRILRGVAAGLQAAHEAGVVHRDLKPANIMVANRTGDALIMDFGIARLAGSEHHEPGHDVSSSADTDFGTPSALTNATMAGTVVGTIAYMSPEQARAEDVDGRADIYSLGLIVYDMLVGRKRFEGGVKPVQELMKRQVAAPPALRSIDPEIPEPLEAIVMRALQPRREQRQANIDVLVGELGRLDAAGRLLPTIRRLTRGMVAATLCVFLGLAGGTWWYVDRLLPDAPHEPVSVVIADIENETGDPAFDGTLEPMIRRALEGADFISAYDRTGVRLLGVSPPDALNAVAARELAVNQGVGVVLSGSIAPERNGYEIAMTAMETVTGNVIERDERRAASKDDVLEVATNLVAGVRRALGEDASESSQMFAMASLSATSLDVVRQYAAAQEAASKGRFEDAIRSAREAVRLDPQFGIGYQLLAAYSRNLGRLQEARKYIDEALRYLDGMTERERYGTRGFFYRMTGDYRQCVSEYGELIARYASDVVGHNQRALCLTKLRDMRGAVDEMQSVVTLLPNQVVFRDNLALYSNYAGAFERAEQEARAVQDVVSEPDAYAMLALAFAQLGQGQIPEAAATYRELETLNSLGKSFATSGLADLAAFEGRFADAAGLLAQGATAEAAAGNPDRAAAKLAALAYTRLLQGETAGAVEAASAALDQSPLVNVRFLAARIFAEAGEVDRARALAEGLASELEAEPQAYGKIVEGDLALSAGDARNAIQRLNEASDLLDTWIGRFDLGRAYLAAGAYTQADSQFDQCLTRRGEALSLFLDEEPTYAYLPPVYYYQGRVREGLNSTGFADSYRQYLDLRGASTEDPLLADVRERAGL